MFCLVACAKAEATNDLFASLLAHHVETGRGTYNLYRLNERAAATQVEQSISELIEDGFILDVGNLSELSYIECKGYRVPLGEDRVILRRPETMLQDGNFRIWITIDRDCRVTRAQGISLPPTQL